MACDSFHLPDRRAAHETGVESKHAKRLESERDETERAHDGRAGANAQRGAASSVLPYPRDRADDTEPRGDLHEHGHGRNRSRAHVVTVGEREHRERNE